MRKPAVQWTIAVLLTLTSAVWQRMSGPTYPVAGKVALEGSAAKMKLLRSGDANRARRKPAHVAKKAGSL